MNFECSPDEKPVFPISSVQRAISRLISEGQEHRLDSEEIEAILAWEADPEEDSDVDAAA